MQYFILFLDMNEKFQICLKNVLYQKVPTNDSKSESIFVIKKVSYNEFVIREFDYTFYWFWAKPNFFIYFHVLCFNVLPISEYFPFIFQVREFSSYRFIVLQNISISRLPFLKYFILQAIYFCPDEYRKPFDILVRSFAYPKLRIFSFLIISS